ncbi:BTAD domain-containing putative transcriptional regulator [Nonomuraea typhae]|uniref:BTAD domain-containing putative transcriptional regulator n=1 Tax=Nonomuraea typhae TaxID=2603600 RepID=A0ABW7YU64_9ACTN
MAHFGILGPLRVCHDDDEIRIPGVRPATVLAVLLVRQGAAVPMDVLIREVFDGEEDVRDPRKQVQIHVTRLRKLLQPLGAGIEWQGAGYVLALGSGALLDAHEFERLRDSGQAAARSGRMLAAAGDFRAASALWRGPVLAGLHGPVISAAAARLEETRLDVVEDRIDADLAVGRHREVVPELKGLLAEYPLRERLHGQLMLALYRSERPSAALGAYEEARRRLAAELGADPGPALRRLHERVLRQDPDLAATPEEPPPAELPMDVRAFVGRCDQLRRLAARLHRPHGERPGEPVVLAIDGPGGLGKSALAIHAAHRAAPHYPDGQLYVALHGATPGMEPLPPYEALCRLLRALGVTDERLPKSTDEAAALLRTVTSRRRLLFLLDNAASAAQVRPLLPGGPGCAVLITSRAPLLAVEHADRLHLDELDEPEAVALLAALAGAGRVRAEPEAAIEVAALCGRLPLALRVMGARLAVRTDWTMAEAAARLRDARHRIDELQEGDLGIRSTFSFSYESLSAEEGGEAAIRLFVLLGLLELPVVGSGVAAALAGRTEATVRRALDRLVQAQLLQVAGTGRFAMHDLMRLFAREKAAEHISFDEARSAIQRAAHAYLATGRDAQLMLLPALAGRTPLGPPERPRDGPAFGAVDQVVTWIDAEGPNLLRIARQTGGLPDDQLTIGLAAALFTCLQFRGPLPDLVELALLGLTAARRSGDGRAQATMLGNLAFAHDRRHRLDEAAACLGDALRLWAALGDTDGQIRTLNKLGIVHVHRDEYERAAHCYTESLRLARTRASKIQEASILNNLGALMNKVGKPADGHQLLRAGLAACRNEPDVQLVGMILGNLGTASRLLGRLHEAVSYFVDSLRQVTKTGDLFTEAESHWLLSEVYDELREHGRARQSREKAVAILLDLKEISAGEAARILGDPSPEMPEPIRRQR